MKAKALDHLTELRNRLIVIAISFLLFLIAGIFLSPFVIKQLIQNLALKNVNFVALSPLEFFYTQIKVGIFVAIALSSPIIIYHLIKFIKPSLKNNEAKALFYIIPGFIILFLIGAFFGYFVLVKIGLSFLANLSSLVSVQNLWSIEKFITFIFAMCLGAGLIFQLPLVLLLLKKLNIIEFKSLGKYRAYIYTIIFILAALITPSTDIVTMLLLAVPLILLYEISYLIINGTR